MAGLGDCAIVIMAKWPAPGHSKTRLCPPLLPQQAAELARCFLVDMVREASMLDAQCCVACSPAATVNRFRPLLGSSVVLLPADAPGLGEALADAQEGAFGLGYRSVALVGGDVPQLPALVYAEAFAALQGADVVLGPSGDGGYYLLATRRPTPELFAGVDWSTERVLDQTLQQAAAAGLTVAFAPQYNDVDTPQDLAWLGAELAHTRPHADTLAYLRHLAPELPTILREAADASPC